MIQKKILPELGKSFAISLWFMFLTFPIMVIKINPLEKTVQWRWMNLIWVGIAAFFLSFLWRYFLAKKELGSSAEDSGSWQQKARLKILSDSKIYIPVFITLSVIILLFPLFFSAYQTQIIISALMYVVLGLGLNIVVGLAGLLDLGYVAFYAVGAYAYALLNRHFGIGFWMALPLCALMSAFLGILLGFPILRLRGDYLAIVTLGFGQIVRLILENWNEFSQGPSGIAGISRPGFFGSELTLHQHTIYLYYIMICLVIFTVFVVSRLKNSRIGRAWIALREDETACQAMGIDKAKTKLTAYALGATWAGLVGCIFAAKTTFINPASFTLWESVLILCIVVLGGMGSVIGIMLGAFILILLPEYLRAFADFRMIVFGVSMVVMMIFRPQGIITGIRQHYQFQKNIREISR